jgi:predicted Zn-dependent protease
MRAVAIAAAATVLASCLDARPALGDDGGQLSRILKRAEQLQSLRITEEDEIKLGEAVSERVRTRYGVVQDEAVHRYVSLVGTVLVQAGPRPNLPWKFIVLDTDGVNAFAAPGGFIHVTRGALGLVRDESELAAVLAHEIVHVTSKHSVEAIQKGKVIEIGARETLRDRAVFNRVVDKTAEIVMAGFGRSEELESDREAARVVNKAGYSPAGLHAFLTRISERNRESTEKQGLFASHPEMKERLERLARQVPSEGLDSTATLADRYDRHVSYEAKPQAGLAEGVEGAAGLTSGGSSKTTAPPKKKGIGIANLLKPSGPETKSAQVTGSGASRGVDTEREAKGGPVATLVAVVLKPAEVSAFKKEGNLE